MGIRGAAVATVAGYSLSMILAFALLLGQKAESAGKNQGLSFAKADDSPYFCLWPAIFYYERPQFVYGDVRQSVPGGVFRYGDCFLRRIL